MPAGVLTTSPIVIPGPMSSSLDSAAIPVPSSGAWDLIGSILTAPNRLTGDPHPEWLRVSGRKAPIHDLVWFDRIHVIPRRKDFGAVLTDQEIQVDVWNAFTAESKKLTAISIEGPAGIEVENPFGLPTDFPATESKLYTVRALAEGDPTIDNLVTWHFVGIAVTGTNIVLTGFRLVPWPFEPNMVDPITEKYGYLTEVIEAYDGTEQRIQLRQIPIGSLGFSVLLEDQEAQLANSLLFGYQARGFGVPLWQFRGPLKALANAGDLELQVDTDWIPFQPGGLVFLWRNALTWEAQRIAQVQSGKLVLSLPLKSTWPVGASVMPLVIGRLSNDEAFLWESLRLGDVALTFAVEGFKP